MYTAQNASNNAIRSPGGRLPEHGWSIADTMSHLETLQANDVRWKQGRVFSLAYYAGAQVHELATEAYRRFSGDNALNVDAFPSLRTMQNDVLRIVGVWLAAPASARGYFTSGGTESILMAVKAARDQFREAGVRQPNVVLPTSAHAAFEKAGAYFDVEMRRVDVDAHWRADATAMAQACDANTIMLVASAPQYPQGVIDPIAEVAEVALRRGLNCHVDACMGGVTLPYLERLGTTLPAWNFVVDGVTSMSVDLHKFGYTAKGASVIMYRNAQLRSHQGFVTDNWLGGLYGSSGMLGTKSGGPIAAAWAVLHHLGDDGYLALTAAARDTTLRIAGAIEEIPQLALRAAPDTTLLSFGAAVNEHDGSPVIDVFALGDALATRGWYVDRQAPPASLHLTVNAVHADTVDAFIADLCACVEELSQVAANEPGRPANVPGRASAYGTLE